MVNRLWLTPTLVLLLSSAGCTWRRAIEFESTERHERVEIYQPSLDPMLGLRVDLVAADRRSTLLKAGESYIGFAHAFWLKSGPIVGILICGTREVRLAYDTKAGKEVSFTKIEGDLNADIRKTYGEAPDKSPPVMCIGSYYQDQFRRRFPNVPH